MIPSSVKIAPMLRCEVEVALEQLSQTVRHLFTESALPHSGEAFSFPLWTQAVSDLGGLTGDDTPGPAPEAIIEKWHLLADQNATDRLSARDFRLLCGTQAAVADARFRNLCLEREPLMTRQAAKYLLHTALAAYYAVQSDTHFWSLLERCLKAHVANDRQIEKWLNSPALTFSGDGSKSFSHELVRRKKGPEELCKELSLSQTSEFVSDAAGITLRHVIARVSKLKGEDWEFLLDRMLPSRVVPRSDFDNAIGAILLDSKVESTDVLRQRVIDFCLINEDLGDPRLHPERWLRISEVARSSLIGWLSQEDISFFFELLLKKEDPHGRKDFWLDYTRNVRRSRVYIALEDRQRSRRVLAELESKGRSFGLGKKNTGASAFVLDFGRLVVVEFSQVKNACYLYERHQFEKVIGEDFWLAAVDIDGLKDQRLALESVSHTSGWQEKLARTLASHGIRRT